MVSYLATGQHRRSRELAGCAYGIIRTMEKLATDTYALCDFAEGVPAGIDRMGMRILAIAVAEKLAWGIA